jgi:hypothetical protein
MTQPTLSTMNELATYQIIACVIALMTFPAVLFKWLVKDTKYEQEATIFLFVLDLLFTSLLYYAIVYHDPAHSGVYIAGVSIAFFAITYYKVRKFYLHKYH